VTPPDRYSSPEQRARFERLAADLDLDLADLECRIPNPAAFELDVLRGNLRPFLALLPVIPAIPKPRRRTCRTRAKAAP
jgi:hypothetical protein